MNEDIRKAILELFREEYVAISATGLANRLTKQYGAKDVYRTINLMKDTEELVPEGVESLRLGQKAIHAQAPRWERTKKYMADNWLVLTALGLSVIGTLSGVAGTVIALIALYKH